MNDLEVKKGEKPEGLLLAEDLIRKGKSHEALNVLFNFEKKGGLKEIELIMCYIIKSKALNDLGIFKDAIKLAGKGYEECQRLSNNLLSIEALIEQARGLQMLGELDKSFDKLEQCEDLLKTLKEKTIEIKRLEARVIRLKGNIYVFRGDERQSIEYQKRALILAKEIDDKDLIGTSLNNLGERYRIMGDLDRALMYAERGLKLYDDFFVNKHKILLVFLLSTLISITLDKDDLEKTQTYFQRLEQLNSQEDDGIINLIYRECKALILMRSPRARNRVIAEELLRQIVEEDVILFEVSVRSLIKLCELLLTELQITNDIEIVDEIKPLITRLLDIAEDQHSNWILVETYILQSKLALITLDIEESRRLLTLAQKKAEKYNLNRLAMIISNEHDELLKQLKIWEDLKEIEAPFSKRMELARLSDYINHMLRKHIIDTPGLETEQPILLTIMSREGVMIFSNPFTADMIFDVNRIGDFLTSFNTFSDQIFSETLDRVKFLDFTLILKELNSFILSYMFKGQSYNAQQRLVHFFEILRNEADIINILVSAEQTNQTLSIKEIPAFEEIISESFITDPQKFNPPFKAYDGNSPFIFVSYSHADKLHVYPVIDYLNKGGAKIWYDEGIPISENWRKIIVDHIEKCKCFLVFITPHIINSDYVQKEINFALKRKKPFFSVFLRETKLPSEIEFEISNIQYMNKYLMSESEFYNKLEDKISSLLN